MPVTHENKSTKCQNCTYQLPLITISSKYIMPIRTKVTFWVSRKELQYLINYYYLQYRVMQKMWKHIWSQKLMIKADVCKANRRNHFSRTSIESNTKFRSRNKLSCVVFRLRSWVLRFQIHCSCLYYIRCGNIFDGKSWRLGLMWEKKIGKKTVIEDYHTQNAKSI